MAFWTSPVSSTRCVRPGMTAGSWSRRTDGPETPERARAGASPSCGDCWIAFAEEHAQVADQQGMNRRLQVCVCHVRWVVLAVFAALLVVVPAASAAGRKPVVRKISRLYSQTAPAGSLLPVKGTNNRYVLRLVGVSNQAVWFSDRPARGTGVIPTRAFGRAWKSFGFVADPPNAVLTLLGADAQQDTIVLKLGLPHYDRRRHTISYSATRLGHATANLAGYEATRDARVPHRFADASLFIDDASAPVINGCVIAEWASCPGANL